MDLGRKKQDKLTTGEGGIDLIKKFEGASLVAYKCPANIWTIGYGNTSYLRNWVATDSNPAGIRISAAFAEQLLRHDLRFFEKTVNNLFEVNHLRQNEFDAIISFSFNIGIGAFKNSSLLKIIRDDKTNVNSIKFQFLKWKYINGKISPGLLRRRIAEFELFFHHTLQ